MQSTICCLHHTHSAKREALQEPRPDSRARQGECEYAADSMATMVFWRKCDAKEWLSKVRSLVGPPQAADYARAMLVKMQALLQPIQQDIVTLNVTKLDGTTVVISVPSVFYQYVDTQGGGLQTCMTTVRDIKAKLEEVCGIEAVSQMLYVHPAEGERVDEQSLYLQDDDSLSECNLVTGQTVNLTIDTRHAYWRRHAALVRKYHGPLVEGYTAIKKAMICAQRRNVPVASASRSKVERFLMCCRKAVAFLSQRSATHKPLTMSALDRVEVDLRKKLPMLQAIAKSHRIRHTYDNTRMP